MDSYVGTLQAAGGSMIMLAKGNRSKQVGGSLTHSLPNKLLSTEFLVCFNFQSASMSLDVGGNVV